MTIHIEITPRDLDGFVTDEPHLGLDFGEYEARRRELQRQLGATPAETTVADEDMLAAVRDHQAHPTRYERQLNIPAYSAFTHREGSRWQPDQMCPDQWRQLGEIRARDRERKRRQRELVAS